MFSICEPLIDATKPLQCVIMCLFRLDLQNWIKELVIKRVKLVKNYKWSIKLSKFAWKLDKKSWRFTLEIQTACRSFTLSKEINFKSVHVMYPLFFFSLTLQRPLTKLFFFVLQLLGASPVLQSNTVFLLNV